MTMSSWQRTISPDLRILVVDDSPTGRMLTVSLLRQAGFQVIQAADGIEAIRRTLDERPGLLLMDIAMPGMAGTEAAALIRTLPADISDVPVIALTANDEDDIRARCLDAGMDDYLAKPYRKADLLAVVLHWAGRRHGTGPRAPLARPCDQPTA